MTGLSAKCPVRGALSSARDSSCWCANSRCSCCSRTNSQAHTETSAAVRSMNGNSAGHRPWTLRIAGAANGFGRCFSRRPLSQDNVEQRRGEDDEQAALYERADDRRRRVRVDREQRQVRAQDPHASPEEIQQDDARCVVTTVRFGHDAPIAPMRSKGSPARPGKSIREFKKRGIANGDPGCGKQEICASHPPGHASANIWQVRDRGLPAEPCGPPW